jgi:hypothetical protein
MDKNIFAALALDKSKSFGCIKPLYGPCFFQDDSFCNLTPDYRLSAAPPTESKDSKAGPARFKRRCKDDTHFSLTSCGTDGSDSAGMRLPGLAWLALAWLDAGGRFRRLPPVPAAAINSVLMGNTICDETLSKPRTFKLLRLAGGLGHGG